MAARVAKVLPDRRNAVSSLPGSFSEPISKEPSYEREGRLQREMKLNSKVPYCQSIPYEYVGNDIRHRYPSQTPDAYRMNYPDWHKLTPAYKLSFSGMTNKEHAKSFFTPGNVNSGLQRAKRWADEEKIVIYSDPLDKLSTLAGILILLMVFTITLLQIRSNSSISYQAANQTNKGDVKNAKRLTKLSNNSYWNVTKLFLTGVPMIISAINVFKRTTVPSETVRILNFEKGVVEKGAIATDSNLRKHARISERDDSIAPSSLPPLPSASTIESILPERMGISDDVSGKYRPLENNKVETYEYLPESEQLDEEHQLKLII